jgi:hypothetical protein
MKWRQAKKKRMVRRRRDAIRQRKMLFQELEPRVLYSADGIGGTHALQQALDTLGSDLDDAAASQFAREQIAMAVGHFGGAGLSAGVLARLFRAGSLLASVLSVMPLWTRMDPLPVLLAKKRGDDEQDEIDDEEKEAARILDGGRTDRREEHS